MNHGSTHARSVGAVVIGRNEGERLRRCLLSLAGKVERLVYVDSGSRDGSVALARAMGADVVELDTGRPFTAARARNVGLARLRAADPSGQHGGFAGQWVQFVDGDCEVAPGWIEEAVRAITADPTAAVVCGRRRERRPEASIYNRLCDIEWNTPVGLADACGGDALMRIAPLVEVGGYNANLIAGEEPELCLRLRQRGHRILRIDADMTLHDANITRFAQWWKRTVRSGHAYAEGFMLHRREPERFCAKQVRSNLVWGALLPLAALVALPLSVAGAGLAVAAYAVLAARVFIGARRHGLGRRDARLFATFVTIGKLPCALGQLRYLQNRLRGQHSTIIEYKGAES
jgi:glycosyltransferase involved in cell wall biosynthesis